jgi:hypothetical protein
MRTHLRQTPTRSSGAGGLEGDGVGINVGGASRVGIDSGGSWLSGRRGGCGIASPWPLRLPQSSRSILTRALLSGSKLRGASPGHGGRIMRAKYAFARASASGSSGCGVQPVADAPTVSDTPGTLRPLPVVQPIENECPVQSRRGRGECEG